MKKTIAKISKTKNWFFEKMNIDKPLPRLIKKKKESMQINKTKCNEMKLEIRNEN